MTMLTTLLLAGATITLPIRAEVHGTEFTLGQVAAIESTDATEVARLEAVKLGYAPSPGFSRLLQAARIEETVRRQAPDLEFRIAGQPACRVHPAIERVDPKDLVAFAEKELEKLALGQDASWVLSQVVPAIEVPAGAGKSTLRVRRGAQKFLGGPVSIPVQVEVDGEPYRTVYVTWDVSLFETVPVLVKDVPAGARLTPAMFARERRRVVASGLKKPLGQTQVVGSIAARDMRAGVPVAEIDVHRPIAVQIGRSVTLEVVRGPIQARTNGIALESGAVGDRIRVNLQPQNREMTGVIVGQDYVRLDLGQNVSRGK
jgi:flagella basal body P-ring formation protein FlgA